MILDLGDVDFLRLERARAGLDWLSQQSPASSSRLAVTAGLRRSFTPRECSLLLEQWELQHLGREAFRDPAGLLLERSALQQATHWQVAEHRASQLRVRLGASLVVEVGCGLGGDTLELLRGGPVQAWEKDEVRARLASHNCGLSVHEGDFFESNAQGEAVFLDPSRRSGERRIFDPERFDPPLSQAAALRKRFGLVCIKAAPGLGDEHIPDECEVEFISHQHTCKEAVLWLFAGARGRRASVFTSRGWVEVREQPVPGEGVLEPGGYVHEPDPALLRARALGTLAQALEAGWLDPTLGYLVGRAARRHPLAQSFKVLDVGPLNLKEINRRLQSYRLSPLEIKKRGVPIEPEEYRRKLKLVSCGRPGVLILTRRAGQAVAILAERASRLGETD